MSLITGNKVKKNHTSQGIVKKKRAKPSCGTIALYGPFVFFYDMADYL
jgi:hypothetical protein